MLVDDEQARATSFPPRYGLACWCLLVAALMIAFVCAVLVSHRPPGSFVLILAAPVVAWIYLGLAVARGGLPATRMRLVAGLLLLLQSWSGTLAARWVSSYLAIGTSGSTAVLTNFVGLLVFGCACLPFRALLTGTRQL